MCITKAELVSNQKGPSSNAFRFPSLLGSSCWQNKPRGGDSAVSTLAGL